MATTLRASCPHFCVRDIDAALDYYVDKLGFERPPLWGNPPPFAMPSRDGFVIMLNAAGESRPNGGDLWDAYFWCSDATALYEEFVANGATIEHGPIERPLYGMLEIAVRDPDGHIIAFGSDTALEA